jgi:hypothetical protein
MKTFQEECSELAPLESFDPAAFRADASVPQELCSFVLSLAVAYNDCKDLIYARIVVGDARPTGLFKKTRLWGAWSGVESHIFRSIVGLVNELFGLIRDNEHLLRHPFFGSVVWQLDRPTRQAWKTVVAVALGSTPADPFGKSLLLIRNKVSFHYDAKAIFAGYRHHFLSPGQPDERAFISRGNTMKESRFYFADAAALEYVRSIVGHENLEAQIAQIADLLKPVSRALMAIVKAYVQKRGYAYRGETDEVG